MKYFEASFGTVLLRFYAMIAVALIAGFANIPWLGLLCIPIFLSAMMGVKFDFGRKENRTAIGKSSSSRSIESSVKEAA